MSTHHSTKVYKTRAIVVKLFVMLIMFLLGMFVATSLMAQGSKETPGNFYAITGNGLKDTSWLFGTYHLVKSSYLNEVPAVVHAFNKAKGVTVELVIDSTKTVAAAAMGLLKDKSLSELVDDPFKDSLDNELKTILGVGIEQLNQLKPINVALILSMVYLVSDPQSPLQKYSGPMLDAYFAEEGKMVGKKISEFETMEEQMNILFNSATNDEQVNQLKYFLRNKTVMKRQGDEIIAQWFKHDLDKMHRVSEKGLAVFGNEEELINNRNSKWMKMLPNLLANESQFVAVGSLHLAGPNGLVKQLQQLGYTLTPIKL